MPGEANFFFAPKSRTRDETVVAHLLCCIVCYIIIFRVSFHLSSPLRSCRPHLKHGLTQSSQKSFKFSAWWFTRAKHTIRGYNALFGLDWSHHHPPHHHAPPRQPILRTDNRCYWSSMPDFDIHLADLIAIKCTNAETMRLNACLDWRWSWCWFIRWFSRLLQKVSSSAPACSEVSYGPITL